MAIPSLFLGAWKSIDQSAGVGEGYPVRLPAHHLVTPSVLFGSNGSGKTGLVNVVIEEALRGGIPTLIFDVKGDLPNLLLSFPRFDPADILPWIDSVDSTTSKPLEQVARELNEHRRQSLKAWAIGEAELGAYVDTRDVRVITPGANAGELLSILSPLERRSKRWEHDPEALRETLSAAFSLILRLIGRDPDPCQSREHVLLSVLAEMRLRQGRATSLRSLIDDLTAPPIDRVGALGLDAFLPKAERRTLAAALSLLLTSPNFATWREGIGSNIGEWFASRDSRTPAIIVSLAHLAEQERALVLDLLFTELLAWIRSLPGSSRLRALVVCDEFDSVPSTHPANASVKRPLLSLVRRAQDVGVGILLATKSPAALDETILAEAGFWCVGRHRPDPDCSRILEALSASSGDGVTTAELGRVVRNLTPGRFITHDAHSTLGTMLLRTRYPMSLRRGPMTRSEIRLARELPLVGTRVAISGHWAKVGT